MQWRAIFIFLKVKGINANEKMLSVDKNGMDKMSNEEVKLTILEAVVKGYYECS